MRRGYVTLRDGSTAPAITLSPYVSIRAKMWWIGVWQYWKRSRGASLLGRAPRSGRIDFLPVDQHVHKSRGCAVTWQGLQWQQLGRKFQIDSRSKGIIICCFWYSTLEMDPFALNGCHVILLLLNKTKLIRLQMNNRPHLDEKKAVKISWNPPAEYFCINANAHGRFIWINYRVLGRAHLQFLQKTFVRNVFSRNCSSRNSNSQYTTPPITSNVYRRTD